VIYDQSGHGNNLTPGTPGTAGGTAKNADKPTRAGAAPVRIDGRAVYGVSITPGVGHRIDRTRGVAVGKRAEGIYEVVAGNHTNDQCCFDFGNAETGNHDDGTGHMEAIYYGSLASPAGTGPSVKADTENGLPFSGAPTTYRFTTAMLTDNGTQFQVLHGNAGSGELTPERNFSSPAHKEGAIVLGIGGDNSNWAEGTFYTGIMTSGTQSRAAQNAIQGNSVAARYLT
jgi:non-reducing end alpha-L-arabinofuranosidase